MRTFSRSARAAIVAALTLLITLAPAATPAYADTILTVRHPPVTPTFVQGSGIGAIRGFYTEITFRGGRAGKAFMTGTLTTTGVTSDGSHEVRMANLVFVLGRSYNQIVVGGMGYSPADGSTLAVGDTAVRPIIGGSGRYARAHGWVLSTNLGDRGWTHEFHITRS